MGFSERVNTILNKMELFLSHVRGKTVLGNVKGGEVPWEKFLLPLSETC